MKEPHDMTAPRKKGMEPAYAQLREGATLPFASRSAVFDCAGGLLAMLLLLMFSIAAQAQFNYTIYSGTAITINAYNGSSNAVIIPGAFSGVPVTSIAFGAFNNRSTLASITIPDSVRTIGDYAFYNCPNLTSVYVRGNAPLLGGSNVFLGDNKATVYYIVGTTGWGATYGLRPVAKFPYTYTTWKNQIAITSYVGSGGVVTIPGSIDGVPVTGIGAGAFQNCGTLTGVTIPNSVTILGDGAFQNCGNLASATISSNITSIGNNLFNSCGHLINVTIPVKVTSIGESAFDSCSSLAEITLPNKVASIGINAFSGCTNLATITIPDSVQSIGAAAFSNCATLSGAIFRGNAPSMGTGVFNAADSGFTVYFFNGKAGFTSPTWEGYPTADAGTYFKDFSGLVSLWDISGSYSGVVAQKIGPDIGLDFTLQENQSGKFIGGGTLNSDDGSGNVLSGVAAITGNVSNSGTLIRVSMTVSASGTGTAVMGIPAAIHAVNFTEKMSLTGEIDGTTSELIVTGGSVSLSQTDPVTRKKSSKSTKLVPGAGFVLPADVTGGWNITLNLTPTGTQYKGTGTVETSTGGTANLKATGSYAFLTDTSKITLSGSGGCSLNMAITVSGTSMTVQTATGKLFGQSVKFKAP
jgi:hypothetical protein